MQSGGTENRGKLWGWAAATGVLAFLVLKLLVDYDFWPALLLAILIGILVAILMWIGFYRDNEEPDMGLGASTTAKVSATSVQEAANIGAVTKKGAAAAAKPAAKAETAPAAKAKPAAKSKTATKSKPAAKAKTTAKAKPAKKVPAAKSAVKPVAADGKPALLKKARDGGGDDLKVIKGVGPGLEKTLNELGFYHYDQIGGWRKKEIEWVDARLKFKGRIVRDGWVKQCKSLAKGA